MKLNVTQTLKTLDGKDLLEATCPACGRPAGSVIITLRDVLTNALMSKQRGEQIATKQQVERYQLGLRIASDDEVELNHEEAALLQEQVAKVYAPLVTGQVWLLLEGND